MSFSSHFHFSLVLANEVMRIFIYIFQKSCLSCLANGNHCKENHATKVTKNELTKICNGPGINKIGSVGNQSVSHAIGSLVECGHTIHYLLLFRGLQFDPKLWLAKKDTNLNNFFLLMKSSEIIFNFSPAFYLIKWLMTSPKNFEKIPILKTWQMVFFWGIKTYFGILPLKWCIFRHKKINILTKIHHSF